MLVYVQNYIGTHLKCFSECLIILITVSDFTGCCLSFEEKIIMERKLKTLIMLIYIYRNLIFTCSSIRRTYWKNINIRGRLVHAFCISN